MSWGVLNGAMLVGLAGAALPVIIHLLNRRRIPVMDWGAMQFLEPGRRARRRIRLAELLLMAARMSLLAIVALAMARPFWAQRAAAQTPAGAGSELAGPPRDTVLVLDVSDSMARDNSGTPPLARATAWARTFVKGCRPGDSIALLLAGDRVRRPARSADVRHEPSSTKRSRPSSPRAVRATCPRRWPRRFAFSSGQKTWTATSSS